MAVCLTGSSTSAQALASSVTSAAFSSQRTSSVSSVSFQGLRRVERCTGRVQSRNVGLASVERGTSKVTMAVSVPVVTFEGEKAGEAELGLRTARPETAKSVVHRGVITELQNRRRGTASTLTRSEVRGGGRKPYKQKGSGNARRGSQRTPLRPGGGVVFGPKPCDWTIKINKKEKQLAISTALQSASVSMTVVEDLNEKLSEPKTKVFVEALARWGIDYKKDYALLFTTDLSENVFRASKNIQRLKVITPRTLNLYDILRADKLIVTKDGLEYLNDRYPEDEYLEEEFEMEAPLDVVEESSEESEESEEEPEQS